MTNKSYIICIVALFTFFLVISVIAVISDIHFNVACSTKGGVSVEDKGHIVCMQGKVIQV